MKIRRIKTEWIAWAAVIAALLLYLGLRTSGRVSYRLPETAPLAKATATRLELVRQGTLVRLDRQGEHWVIPPQNYPADEGKVAAMLEALAGLRFADLVAESKTYGPYGLDEAHRLVARAFAGERMLRELWIGNVAPTYRHTYAMLPGDDRVYQAAGSFRSDFDLAPDALRDRLVLRQARTDLQEAEIAIGTEKTVLRRVTVAAPAAPVTGPEGAAPVSAPPEKWLLADGSEADPGAVDALLAPLADLFCERYWDGKRKEELATPLAVITCRGAAPATLSIFAKENPAAKEYPATSSQSAFPFFLSAERAEALIKKPADFLKKK
jgi:hypothetical protein